MRMRSANFFFANLVTPPFYQLRRSSAKMKLLLAVAFLVVAYASVSVAQEEYKCVAPPEWYAHFFEMNPARREERRGRIYYDEGNQRIAIREERIEGFNNITYYWEIFNHNEKKGYRINLNETMQDCRVFPLQEDFPMIGPYLNDKFDGEYTIGSSAKPKDGVQVLVYSGTTDHGDFYGVWIPAGPDSCLPVSETYTSRVDGSTNTRRYYDIRVGIFDYSVFDPPSYC